MTLHILNKDSVFGRLLSVQEKLNNIQGSSGLNLQQINQFFDESYYTVNIPWNLSILGSKYNTAYVSSNSLISFDIPTLTGTSITHKIFIGTPKNSSTTGVYSKNFYYNVDGIEGSRTLRMRFEGGFKTSPQNITSTSITNNLLGRQSLTKYNISEGSVFFQIPWNINFNVNNGDIQNGIKVYTFGLIEFFTSFVANNRIFTDYTSNDLSIGYGPTTECTGIWGGIEGSSPNRTYRIRYEGFDTGNGNAETAWELYFYENNQNIIDVQTAGVADYFSLDQNGFYSDGSLLIDLQNDSENYSNFGTRFSQTYQNSSLIWEAIFYEDGGGDTIDIQMGERIDPSSSSISNYLYGLVYKNSLLEDFSSTSNAGYRIVSTSETWLNSGDPQWIQPQSVYTKIKPLGLSSQWQKVRSIYVRDSGVWKLIQPPPGPVYFFCRRSTYQNDTYGNKGGTGIASFQNESFVVPSGVTEITVELWGGGGSGGAALNGGDSNTAVSGAGGGGGYVKATLSVTPGETLTIRVGGGGWQYAANVVRHPNLTISGLSNNNIQMVSRRSDNSLLDQDLRGGIGGSGGGYSAIFRGLTPLVVAGGGGGGGGTVGYFVGSLNGDNAIGGNGGAGGGDIGQSGTNGNSIIGNATNGGKGGGGGTQSTGGAGGAGPTASACISSDAESGSYLTGGRGKNNPEYQGNLSGSTLIPDNGTASNPGTNGGAAGGGSARTRNAVCNSTGIGIPNFDPNSVYPPSSCGGGGGGGYYGGGGGGVGRYNFSVEDTSVGGGGGGGGSNYVGGALSVISNSQGSGRVPGNTTSPYYLTSYLYAPQTNVPGVPFNSFAQGGVGYGGESGISPILDKTTIYYGSRGENGLVVIYW